MYWALHHCTYNISFSSYFSTMRQMAPLPPFYRLESQRLRYMKQTGQGFRTVKELGFGSRPLTLEPETKRVGRMELGGQEKIILVRWTEKQK